MFYINPFMSVYESGFIRKKIMIYKNIVNTNTASPFYKMGRYGIELYLGSFAMKWLMLSRCQ